MCGIIGAFNLRKLELPFSREQGERATDVLSHRGPDARGTWWSPDRSVFLGHRRLSIIDLSDAGRQPMTNADQSVQLVFNGEIYNFAEIRRDLERKGYSFASRTDSEVIVHGYSEYGVGIIDRLRGMFAIALYDVVRDQLLLARDRMGVKPLYVAEHQGTLYFASEIRGLLAFQSIPRELDTAALDEYMTFGKVYAPRTMFRGVQRFPAASRAIQTRGGTSLAPECYWSAYDHPVDLDPNAPEEDWSQHLLSLLQESVDIRMVSDVPVGVFLSGGVDSTANLAMMSRFSSEPIRTFTAGFQGEGAFDEREAARATAKLYGAEHHEVEINRRDIVEHLPEISGWLDEPVADPTVIPIYFLSRLARSSGALVILNGDGGDELFCGYNKYMQLLRVYPWWQRFERLPRWSRRAIAQAGRVAGLGGVRQDLLERSAGGVEMYIGSTGPLKGTRELRMLTPNGRAMATLGAVREGRREFNGVRRSNDYAEWLSWWGLRSEVEHVFLYRADRMGMANSIEIRVPFLDQRVVEFAQQMPQGLKYRNGTTKHILKKALEPIVPYDILHRRKQGFCVPLRSWGGDLMESTTARVLPRIHADWGVLPPEFLSMALSRARNASQTDQGGALSWMLFNLAVWYDNWFGGGTR